MRTWMFLLDFDMVSDGREHPSEVSVKVSSRSDIRNHVKTPPVLQVSSWSLGGHGHSWWTWRWCQMGVNTHQKCLWKFHQDQTKLIMSMLEKLNGSFQPKMCNIWILFWTLGASKSTFLGSKSTQNAMPIHEKNDGAIHFFPWLPTSLWGVFFGPPCIFSSFCHH